MSEWISVKDRLPKRGDHCLAVETGCYEYGKFIKFYSNYVDIAIYNGEDFGSVHNHRHVEVTHWMPLPEAPEEE